MFIKISTLARMMKKADKAGILRIGCDPDGIDYGGYYIGGACWCIHFIQEDCPKEVKAEIIRYTGEMPKGGEECLMQKGYAQLCQYGVVGCFLPEYDATAENSCVLTRYTINQGTVAARVYQDQNGDVIGVDERFLELIDQSNEVSGVNVEDARISKRGSMIWSDDDTILEIWPEDLKNTNFAKFTKGIDLTLPDPSPNEPTDTKEASDKPRDPHRRIQRAEPEERDEQEE